MQIDPLIQRVTLTPDLAAQLDQVNQMVNAEIAYVPDQVKYGVPEKWEDAELEGNQGDCEDFVFAKRRRLRALGWPLAALDFVMCWDETGAYHCVLAVRTDQGDKILDSRQAGVWDMDTDLAAKGYRIDETTVGGTFANWRKV